LIKKSLGTGNLSKPIGKLYNISEAIKFHKSL